MRKMIQFLLLYFNIYIFLRGLKWKRNSLQKWRAWRVIILRGWEPFPVSDLRETLRSLGQHATFFRFNIFCLIKKMTVLLSFFSFLLFLFSLLPISVSSFLYFVFNLVSIANYIIYIHSSLICNCYFCFCTIYWIFHLLQSLQTYFLFFHLFLRILFIFFAFSPPSPTPLLLVPSPHPHYLLLWSNNFPGGALCLNYIFLFLIFSHTPLIVSPHPR